MVISSSTSAYLRPMKRLTLKMVFSGLVTACRLATVPTSRSPVFEKPTTDGVVRPPSALGRTSGSPPVRTATAELVVPRSMPIVLPMCLVPPRGGGPPAAVSGRNAAAILDLSRLMSSHT